MSPAFWTKKEGAKAEGTEHTNWLHLLRGSNQRGPEFHGVGVHTFQRLHVRWQEKETGRKKGKTEKKSGAEGETRLSANGRIDKKI